MGRVDVEERVPFLHGRGVGRDGELEQPGLVPDFDRLDEFAGGELAGSDGPRALAVDPGANGVGHAGGEEPVGGRVKVAEADDVLPDDSGGASTRPT